MMLAGSAGDALEENAPLASPTRSRSTIPKNGGQIRRRLAVCLFMYTAGCSIALQIYPKVILEYFNDDDGEASKFSGWLALFASLVDLIAIPTLCSASDAVGRRAVLGGAFALSAASALALGLAPNSIVAVAAVQIVSSVAGATLPVGQAIIIDISYWGEGEGKGEVARGLGLIGATVGMGVTLGPVVGGALSELHRGAACYICATMSLLALLSLRFYGWEDTAPQWRLHTTTTAGEDGGGERGGRSSAWWPVNPFSALSVFLESSPLMLLALCIFFFTLALDVFGLYYNYLDFRYHWSALEISFFYSSLGVLLALMMSIGIRFLVPKRLSEKNGTLVGLTLQASSAILYGLAPRGWMMYPVLLVGTGQFVLEPCAQAIMARLVSDDLQGSLQGAIMILRIVANGVAGPFYGQAFSLGVSGATKKALGVLVPGLPLFLASLSSLCGLAVARRALQKLSGSPDTPPVADTLDVDEEGIDTSSPGVPEDGDLLEAFESAALLVATVAPTPHGEEVDAMEEMSRPLLNGEASKNFSSS